MGSEDCVDVSCDVAGWYSADAAAEEVGAADVGSSG